MVLFLLFSVPVSVTLILINFSRQGNAPLFPVSSFLLGILFFFPGIILYSIVLNMVTQSYTVLGFFFHNLLKDHLVFLIIACGWLLLLRNIILRSTEAGRFFRVLAFFGGYYSAVCVYEYLNRIAHLDFYTLFLQPLLHLTTLIIAVVCCVRFVASYGILKYVWLSGLIVLPLINAVITTLYLRNYLLIAAIGTIIVATGAVVLFFKLKD